MRSTCIKHLKKHAATYGAFWNGKSPDESSKLANFSDYITAVSAPGTWCGYFELAALSNTMDRPIVVAHEAGNFHVFNADGTQAPIALYYNGTNHYQAFVGAVPDKVLHAATKPVPAGHRGGASSIGGRTNRPASVSTSGNTRKASSVAGHSRGSATGRTRKIHSCAASSIGGRTRKGSPSQHKPGRSKAPSFIASDGRRCTKEEASILQKCFKQIVNLNQRNASARTATRSAAAGLASTDQCLCGWTAPAYRYHDDQMPSKARIAHWKNCIRCQGPCPKKPTRPNNKKVEMRETHTQIAARLLQLAVQEAPAWGHKLSEHIVVHGVGRLWKCSACGAMASPYLMLHAVCPQAKGPALEYHARVKWSVALRKRARAAQKAFRSEVNTVKRKAVNQFKDAVTNMSPANIAAHKRLRKTSE